MQNKQFISGGNILFQWILSKLNVVNRMQLYQWRRDLIKYFIFNLNGENQITWDVSSGKFIENEQLQSFTTAIALLIV